jgi:hypothetical protein
MAARTAQDRDRIDRAIHHASWLGALAMFAYGAALSFDVLHTIAQAAGLSPVLAWLWPLGFETFMAVAAVAVLAEQRTRPHKTPWYPWVLTALAAGSSIALNFGHPYIPLDPPPRLLVACVYGVPQSPHPSPGTCSCSGSPTAATRTMPRIRTPLANFPRTRDRTPASRAAGRTSRPRWLGPRPDRPATARTASRPESWSGSFSRPRHRTSRCPGRTLPTRPACHAPVPMRCCGRNASAWPPTTATSPPSTPPTRRRDHPRTAPTWKAHHACASAPCHPDSSPPARPRRERPVDAGDRLVGDGLQDPGDQAGAGAQRPAAHPDPHQQQQR